MEVKGFAVELNRHEKLRNGKDVKRIVTEWQGFV